MKLRCLPMPLTVCKVADLSQVKLSSGFFFLAKTDQEISLVCATDETPGNTFAREDGWRALRFEGSLDFALVGILSRISGLLADAGISIFASSTYDTDYVLTKAETFPQALELLEASGYQIIKEES